MRLSSISLQNFRNIEFAAIDFKENRHFLVGNNGVGKTNLLEAIGYITALRSFRTSQYKKLIRWNQTETKIRYCFEENNCKSEIVLRLHAKGKELFLNGEKVLRFADFVGNFPTVALSSHDILLLRGSPQIRRRFIDMTLTANNPVYFEAIRKYYIGLQSRNNLLKKDADDSELESFEISLAPFAKIIFEQRVNALDELNKLFSESYNKIGSDLEIPTLKYKPSLESFTEEAIHSVWKENRKRDRILKTTEKGPHRDDFIFQIFNREAKDYGSEGQQRSLVISLRMAQINWFKNCSNTQPVLLADDILGELDSERREKFWKLLTPEIQVFATGTKIVKNISDCPWEIFYLHNGKIKPQF